MCPRLMQKLGVLTKQRIRHSQWLNMVMTNAIIAQMNAFNDESGSGSEAAVRLERNEEGGKMRMDPLETIESPEVEVLEKEPNEALNEDTKQGDCLGLVPQDDEKSWQRKNRTMSQMMKKKKRNPFVGARESVKG